MTIAHNTSANVYASDATTNAVESGSFTVPSGLSNPYLLAVVVYEANTTPKDVSGVTFNSVAMTKLHEHSQNHSNIPNLEVWGLNAPTAGAHTLAVTFINPTADNRVLISAAVLTGSAGTITVGAVNNAAPNIAVTANADATLATTNPGKVFVAVATPNSSYLPLDVVTGWTSHHQASHVGDGLQFGLLDAPTPGAQTATFSPNDAGGSANNFPWVTIELYESGPAVTAADGTVQIGEAGLAHAPVTPGTEVFTASPAFANPINGATLDPDGAAIDITSLLSGLTAANATLTAPDVSLFRVGGAWNAIRWGTNYEIEFTDGTDTARVNMQFTASIPDRFGAIVTPNAIYHAPGLVANDLSYGLWTTGEGQHNPAMGATTAGVYVNGIAVFQPFGYDLSAGAWIEGTAVEFTDGAIPECPQQLSNSVLGPLHSPVENFTCLRTY